MSKFEAVIKRIEEALPSLQVTPQQQATTTTAPASGAGMQPKPAGSNQPVQPPQTQVQLKNQQSMEKIADELANINDPNKIKQILSQLVQGTIAPQTAS